MGDDIRAKLQPGTLKKPYHLGDKRRLEVNVRPKTGLEK
jgi:hypothetical protein